MAIQTQVGQFTTSTAGTTTTVNCNFQGKAIILFSHGKTSNVESAGAMFSVGVADNATHVQDIAWVGDDAVSTTNVAKGNRATRALEIFSNGTPTLPTGGQLSSIAFNASTFVLTFSATPASAWLIDFILIGGSDIISTFAGSDAMPTTNITKNVTNVGFQGDFVILFFTDQTGAGTAVGAECGIGLATSSTKRWGYGWAISDGQTTSANVNAQTLMRTDRVLVGQSASNVVNVSADFTQFTSTGFDLSFTTAPGTAFVFHYLVIKGGSWDAGTSVKPTGATTQTVTGEVFTPSLLGLFCSSPTASNSNTTTCVSTLGATDGSNQCYANSFHNDAINTVAKSSGSTAACLVERDGANNPTATFTSFNSDGWTITWGATGSAREVSWFTVGNPFRVPESLDIHRSGHVEPHRLVSM